MWRRRRRKRGYPKRYGGFSGRFGRNGGGMLRPEKKFFDTSVAATAMADTGTTLQGTTTTELTAIINGTGENERNGSRIRLMAIHGRMQIKLPLLNGVTTLGTCNEQLRIMIGIDKQANGAHAAVTDLLETAFIHSFRNIENNHRFIWLYDRMIIINQQVTGNGASDNLFDGAEKIIYKSINLKLNMPMYFDGSTGQKGEVRSHQIFMFGISARGLVTVQTGWRVRYYG